jgi:hypothetical protein
MRIIFSRKGFDSGRKSGGAPSPIIDGVPYSLPIPTSKYPSRSKYADLNLGHALSKVKSSCKVGDCCHEDPMFWDNRCAFGQTAAAQTHLKNNCVGKDDVFLFFGLFAKPGCKRHHRIFGYLKVEDVLKIGCQPTGEELKGTPRQHPHTIANWKTDEKWPCNNTIYFGRGMRVKTAHPDLRLSQPNGPASYWLVPPWLRETSLTCHDSSRWLDQVTLRSMSPGQEFVTDIGDRPEPKKWLTDRLAIIEANRWP